MSSAKDRALGFLTEAMAGAERIYARVFGERRGRPELVEATLSEMVSTLHQQLQGTTVVMRQKMMVTGFLKRWELACREDLRKV